MAVEHEIVDPKTLSSRDVYRLMTDLVAPRPIAWVSTVDEAGRGNLAPYSYFQAVSSTPPTVVLGCAWRSNGTPKDTLRNILDQREFTINHVTRELAGPMNETSAEYEPGFNEWMIADRGGPLASTPAHIVRAPRVADALASYECRLTHAIPLGRGSKGKPSSTLVIAEVLCFSVARGLIQRAPDGTLQAIDPARLAAVGRLGGMAYTGTEHPFVLVRPKV